MFVRMEPFSPEKDQQWHATRCIWGQYIVLSHGADCLSPTKNGNTLSMVTIRCTQGTTPTKMSALSYNLL